MGAQETNHIQYAQPISNTVMLSRAKAEKEKVKHPERFLLNVKLPSRIDKKATHLWQ